uniref:C2 domain-containing protein n=1 Tax=Ascaris lumbricoides TaxID=6252 RepID=A0A0M3HR42_ASCLU
MDGFSWLILSWVIVGALCYFALNKLGAPQSEGTLTSSPTYGTASRSQTSEWTNELLAWLYNNLRRVPEPLEAWISSLNEAAKKVSSPSNCEILFEGFGNNSAVKTSPKVSSIRVEQGPKDHLTVKSTIDVAEVNLKLVSSQRVDDRLLVSNFDAKIRDLHGEIEARLACIANQIYVMGCFSGRPELDIQLTNTDSSSAGEVNSAVVEAAIRRCLVSAVTNISLSEVMSPLARHHQQSEERTTSAVVAPVQEMMKRLNQPHVLCGDVAPRENFKPEITGEIVFNLLKRCFEKHELLLENIVPVHQTMISPAAKLNTFGSAQPNKLRVKVIRAQRLGKEIDVSCVCEFADVNQPYVVVEMDEPAQKYTTTKGLNMSPYWEESFEFNLTPASEEILFEIYESVQTTHDGEQRFLGLAIVGFEELKRSAESVHTFTLQGRPYRNDSVSGTLTVQFEFYYDPSVSTLGQQVDQVVVHGSDGSEFRETLSTSKRPIYDPHDSLEGRDVIPTKTTTVSVKAVSQQLKEKPLISSLHGSMESAMDSATAKVLDQTFPRRYPDEGYESQKYEGPLFTSIQPNQSTQVTQSSHTTAQTSHTTQVTHVSQQVHTSPQSQTTQPLHSQQPGKTAQLIQVSHAKQQSEPTEHAESHSPTYQEQRATIAKAVIAQPEEPHITPSQDLSRLSRDRLKKQRVEGQKPEKRDRSFFDELKDRLSWKKSKRRAKSFDLANEDLEEAVSLPPSRDQSRTRHSEKQISRSHHETSSVGEKSGMYYLIPPSIVDEPAAGRLMKHGKKLHIYNEHTFVAVKLRGGTVCNVCHHRIARSFSKQAYQCRDCRLVCHKTCHYKTESYCTASTVSKLEM